MSASRKQLSRKPGIVGVLDVGTSKVACLVAGLDRDPARNRVLGFASQRAMGVKSGVVVDLARAEEAVRAAIARAEHEAGVTLSELALSITCGRLGSATFTANADAAGSVVASGDIDRLFDGARAYAERSNRVLLHVSSLGWRLDGAPCPIEPVGLPGRRISADLAAVTADEPAVRNLAVLAEGSFAPAGLFVAAPLASALSVTSEEERRLGVTVVDIGAGTMTFAAFADGELVWVDALSVGGGLVTSDIAGALHTPLERAERIKTVYGTLIVAPSDAHEEFSYPLAGHDETDLRRTTKAHLASVVRQRMAHLLDLVAERLARAPSWGRPPSPLVITGGASQMTGMESFAALHLGMPARLGRPQSWPGLPAAAMEPKFATVTGVLEAASSGVVAAAVGRRRSAGGAGYFERVGEWLRTGF